MALIRYAPARRSYAVAGDFNRLFGSLFDTHTQGAYAAPQRWVPATDLVETAGEYVLRADLPGLGKDDVSIQVDDNVLTIAGERKSSHEARQDGYYRLERASGRFSRSLRLPEGIDTGAITAGFENGVLEIHVPKPAPRAPQKVEITVGGSEPAATPVVEESAAPVAEQSSAQE